MGLVTARIRPRQSICLSRLLFCRLVHLDELSTSVCPGLCGALLESCPPLWGCSSPNTPLPQSQLRLGTSSPPGFLHPALLGGNPHPRLSSIPLHPAAPGFGHHLQIWLQDTWTKLS